ncbi:MAG: 50S ribosomal protein L10 [Candidatus Phytoplasma asteris]|uniref:Large ribosomal subunit protein uL10 n=1 Tax='Chrysanthemum coronarium' phytoplasma TaxID=1520703 RepID=A0ABQ0J3E5_9MOLU|nr:50S ribosomal protein L10 ['Chrysanthemum coronarium' phytoplasma]TKA87533.1 MAG: 50S ribosomal protein L10 [Periwinkle leaf yellowing phytoplasma]WEX19890.1 MAG: 50S ribosomal protein L10 [Candidatus Phytoplasma asteris]GAK73723.1 ribosomal protein L10 ['Chrysanthemum coronarium' phytoplasma]
MIKPQLAKKIDSVAVLQEKISTAKTVIVFEYASLPVSSFMQLRRELKKTSCEAKVYPKNIMQRAVTNAKQADLVTFLKGAKALIISPQELLEPIKTIYNFAKKNKAVKIVSGIVEQKIVSLQEINTLATLPSKEQMLALLAASMFAPLQHLAIGLNMLVQTKEQENPQQ